MIQSRESTIALYTREMVAAPPRAVLCRAPTGCIAHSRRERAPCVAYVGPACSCMPRMSRFSRGTLWNANVVLVVVLLLGFPLSSSFCDGVFLFRDHTVRATTVVSPGAAEARRTSRRRARASRYTRRVRGRGVDRGRGARGASSPSFPAWADSRFSLHRCMFAESGRRRRDARPAAHGSGQRRADPTVYRPPCRAYGYA